MLKSLFCRSTTYSLLVTVSNKMGWSDQSSIFTFRTRDSGLIMLFTVCVFCLFTSIYFADYSSYNPGYFGKDWNLISKFECILTVTMHMRSN